MCGQVIWLGRAMAETGCLNSDELVVIRLLCKALAGSDRTTPSKRY
jgi:hypothetical protein